MKNKIKVVINKLIPTLIAVATFCMISVGCIERLPVPVYEKTDEDGISVYINDVRYKQLPEIKWYVNPGSNVIGYAGNRYTLIYDGLNDRDKNFVFLKGFLADYYDCILYRTNKMIPEPSADVVDKINWYDHVVETDHKGYTYTTEDKKIIRELFEALETGRRHKI